MAWDGIPPPVVFELIKIYREHVDSNACKISENIVGAVADQIKFPFVRICSVREKLCTKCADPLSLGPV